VPSLALLQGEWLAGDDFWLMTDALAEWFLRRHELQADPAAAIRGFLERPNAAAFTHWVNLLRDTEQLRNDDVTLLALHAESAQEIGSITVQPLN
jgi:hypothetical protein